VDNWADCNIARAAAHAFVSRPGWVQTQSTRRLLAASGSGLSAVMALASTSPAAIANGRDMLIEGQPFTKDTQTMQRITDSFEKYFGSSAMAAFGKMEVLNKAEESRGGGSLSDGAIAGIVIGVSVFCIIVTAALVFVVMRKNVGHSHLAYPKGGTGSDCYQRSDINLSPLNASNKGGFANVDVPMSSPLSSPMSSKV
jgi:hypothetical protein